MENIRELNGNVIHITDDETSRNYKWEKNKVDENVDVVSINDIEQVLKTNNIVCEKSSIKDGAVLIKDPYNPNHYVDVLAAEGDFFKSETYLISRICSNLGVYKVEVSSEKLELRKRTLDNEGSISYGPVKIDGNYKTKKEEKMSELKIYSDIYDNPILTLEGYKEARKIAEEHGLINNPDINHLLDARNPNSVNKLKECKIHIESCKEYNSSLDAAFTLTGIKTLAIKANVKEALATMNKLTYDLKLQFGEPE